MSDRPSLAIAMEDAGIPPAKAEIASVRFDAIHDSMATNRDLFRGETRLKAEIALVEHRLLTRQGGLIVVAVRRPRRRAPLLAAAWLSRGPA